MNVCALTGVAVTDSEARVVDGGFELVLFDICVDGSKVADAPHLHCSYMRSYRMPRGVKAGQRLEVVGGLRYRVDVGLFVGVSKLIIMG